jgi:alpha-N-arabinofuranosidase
LRDALVAGITLNIFHAHADRVRMANIAQAVNVLQAMLLTDGNKLAKTPTYYTFAMYTPFQDATFIPVNAPAPMLKAESGSFPPLPSARRGQRTAKPMSLSPMPTRTRAINSRSTLAR